jgi:hypothetical protein
MGLKAKRAMLAACAVVGIGINAACGTGHGTAAHPAYRQVGGQSQSSTQTSPRADGLVGRWERLTTCAELVGNLRMAGLARLAPYAWLGQTSSTGETSFAPGSPHPTQSHPCPGALDRTHSHFFDRSGRFGSLDWRGGQVDDGTYRIVDGQDRLRGRAVRAETVAIGDVIFHYRIIDGDTLTLAPVLTKAMVRTARAHPADFGRAGWAESVAYEGYTWKRVPCDGWC